MEKLDKTCRSGMRMFGNPVDGSALINYSFYKNYLAEDYEVRPVKAIYLDRPVK